MISNIVQVNGIRGLWKGTGVTLARVGVGAGTYFVALSLLLEDKRSDGKQTFMAGAMSRVFAGIIVSPLTVIKTRMEFDALNVNSTSMWQILVKIVNVDGVQGLYRGLVATMCRDAPYSGLYVLFYSRLKEKVGAEKDGLRSVVVHFGCGVIASLGATCVTHPADTIKTRLQLHSDGKSLKYKLNMRSAIRRLYVEEGGRGFFRGFVPRMMKRAISTALTWTLFEQFSNSVLSKEK